MKKVALYLGVGVLLSVMTFIGCRNFFADDPDVSLVLEKKKVFIAVPPFNLSGGNPPGGNYSGQGVANNRFSPEEAGVGIHEIVYTFHGKSVSDSIEVFGARPRRSDRSCTVCGGTGFVDCRPHVPCAECTSGQIIVGNCATCKGAKRIRTAWKLWFGTKECPDCRGTGLRYETCKRCKGFGFVKCPNCKGTGKAVCKCVK